MITLNDQERRAIAAMIEEELAFREAAGRFLDEEQGEVSELYLKITGEEMDF